MNPKSESPKGAVAESGSLDHNWQHLADIFLDEFSNAIDSIENSNPNLVTDTKWTII